jgi:hypothetical protein
LTPTMYSVPLSSTSRPPTSLFERRITSARWADVGEASPVRSPPDTA